MENKITELDEILAGFEDWMHGYNGYEITRARIILDEIRTGVLANVSKRYYWLKADGTISNMWNEDDHKKYITAQDIMDAEKDGWQLIQINVC